MENNKFSEFTLGFFKNVETMDFDKLLQYITMYVLAFWGIVTIWVFFDARRRYESIWIPVLIFILMWPFNILALFVYILLRPEYTTRDIQMIYGGSLENFSFAQKKGLPAPIRSDNTLAGNSKVDSVNVKSAVKIEKNSSWFGSFFKVVDSKKAAVEPEIMENKLSQKMRINPVPMPIVQLKPNNIVVDNGNNSRNNRKKNKNKKKR